MFKRIRLISFLFISLLLSACHLQPKTFDFPKPVDTENKPIKYQEKKVYQLNGTGIFADNLFDGARLNNFQHIEGNNFRATISPENTPINNSAYYAFRLWSKETQTINLELFYINGKHRYFPKISHDGITWKKLNEANFKYTTDSLHAILNLDLSPDTLWIAAQQIQNSTHVRNWCKLISQHNGADFKTIGKSKLGRDLMMLDINENPVKKKEIIVIMSRQHPPEVTGYLAMQAFVEELLEDNLLSQSFRKKYQILVYPLLNPDGVDLGHWRHNAGGVDLNRDWAYYHQEETRAMASHVVKTERKNKAKVILGLDFHSTWYDIYYTNKQAASRLPKFNDYWLWSIKNAIKENDFRESASNVGRPVSKSWFLTQFDAEGITYEIGDETDLLFIKKKGRQSAIEMMKLLIMR